MDLARLRIASEAARLERSKRDAERREEAALQRAGAELFQRLRAARTQPASGGSARDTLDALNEIDQRMVSLSTALDRSLESDRLDFRSASQLGRWLVIGRGILERMVLRDRMRADRRVRAQREQELARHALDEADPTLRAQLSDAAVTEVGAARAERDSAAAVRARILEPYGGEPLPHALRVALRETRTFFRYVWDQLSSKIFLRAPAVAGLIAGWLVAHAYTDSALEGLGHTLGFGGRKPISAETMRWLTFVVPLFAAALFSYFAAFIAARVEQRYAPPAPPGQLSPGSRGSGLAAKPESELHDSA
jgi:hypothetical protein